MINKRNKDVDRLIKKYMGKKFLCGGEFVIIVGFRDSIEYPVLAYDKNYVNERGLNPTDKLIVKPKEEINLMHYAGYRSEIFKRGLR